VARLSPDDPTLATIRFRTILFENYMMSRGPFQGVDQLDDLIKLKVMSRPSKRQNPVELK